jgi:hypothetical protein
MKENTNYSEILCVNESLKLKEPLKLQVQPTVDPQALIKIFLPLSILKKGKKSNLIDPAVSVRKLMSPRGATRAKYL